jgi:hypothetical protein
MDGMRRVCGTIVLAAALLSLAACGGGGGAGGGAGGGVTLDGDWSGDYVITPTGGNGAITSLVLSLSGTTVTGSMTVNPAICTATETTATLTNGSLTGGTLQFTWALLDTIDFTAAFPANPMNGTYEVSIANGSGPCTTGWTGTFSVTK